MGKGHFRGWIGRLLIGIVFVINIECALVFLIFPDRYLSEFELQDLAGIAIVRGMGILFLMWNVPYFIALLNPLKYRISLIEACVMQLIGFVGESVLFLNIPLSHVNLRATLGRFILFDGAGLILLLSSLWLITKKSRLIEPDY
jgi:hypothetical protein